MPKSMRTYPLTLLLAASFLGAVFIAQADEDLAVGGSFQDEVNGAEGSDALTPGTWLVFSTHEPMKLSILTDPIGDGHQVLRIKSQEDRGSYQGILQKRPVAPGIDYIFKVQVLNDRADP